jgi:hypothetical protein
MEFPAIRNYACNSTGREEAIEEYRKHIHEHGIDYKNVFIQFMREVDTPVPDLALRAEYRKKIKEMPL